MYSHIMACSLVLLPLPLHKHALVSLLVQGAEEIQGVNKNWTCSLKSYIQYQFISAKGPQMTCKHMRNTWLLLFANECILCVSLYVCVWVLANTDSYDPMIYLYSISLYSYCFQLQHWASRCKFNTLYDNLIQKLILITCTCYASFLLFLLSRISLLMLPYFFLYLPPCFSNK